MSEKGREEARIGLDAESELLTRVNEDRFRKTLTSCLRRWIQAAECEDEGTG